MRRPSRRRSPRRGQGARPRPAAPPPGRPRPCRAPAGRARPEAGTRASRSSTVDIRRSTAISTKTGPGLTRQRHVDRAREVLRDEPRLRYRPGALRDGPQERDLVHLLESAPAPEPERRAAADQEEGAPRGVGVRDTGHGVGDAGARHDHGDAEPAGETRPRVRSVRRRLLVADVDHPDAVTEAGVVDRQDVAAAEREDGADALAGENARDQLPSGQVRHATGGAPPGPIHCDTRGRTPVANRSSCSSTRSAGTVK